ncbi:acylneuraminate cytidylyltransferase family protein, partial [Vibrio vulnificus]|nr:acylneuraminate cytidylyltransferase family protein [Vibrio vulnificus]
MKNCAFIFARGGSKGLPRKNIKLLAGKPLLQYSIDTALATPSIEHVFVSTDDAEIADVARASGAIVIERPMELA